MTTTPGKRASHRPQTLTPSLSPSLLARIDWPAVGIVAAALAVRIVAAGQLADHPALRPQGGLDDAVYVEFGRRVASGDLVLGPTAYFVSPFYAYFLGAVFALTNGSLYAARLAQALLGGLSVGLVMQSARLWFGRRAALVAGSVVALTGLSVFNEILILQSSVDPFLTALALLAVTRAVKSQSRTWFALAGVALAALSANRPNVLACLGGVAVVWLVGKRSRAALGQIIALGVGAALILGPLALRNRLVAGELVLLSSHGGLNFLIGNGEGATGTWRSVPGISNSIRGQEHDTIEAASVALGRRASASEASAHFYSLAWDWIRSHPAAWARLLLRKAALSFSASDAALNFSYGYFRQDRATILWWLVVGPWLIIPCGIFGLASGVVRRDAAGYWTWLSFPIVYAFTLTAFFVASRYRLPLLLSLSTGVGAGVTSLWKAVRARALPRVASQVGFLGILFVLVNWPISVNDGRAFQREFHVVHLIADGRVEEAERLLTEAEANEPLGASLLCRVGLVFRERGDVPRAVTYLRRAAALDPVHPWIQFHLGETLIAAERPVDALPHLQAARRVFAASPSRFNRDDGISHLQGRPPGSGAPMAVAAIDIAEVYSWLGQSDQARAVLAEIRPSAALDDGTLLQLGEAAVQLEAPDLAEAFLLDLVSRAPALARAHELLGCAFGMQRRDSRAVSELEQAVRLEPKTASAHLHLALAYAQSHRLPEARTEIDTSLRLDPGDKEAAGWRLRLQGAK